MRVFDRVESASTQRTEQYDRAAVQSEEELESLLHANPAMLLDEDVFIFSRQYPLEGGIPDLLALDKFGNVQVFELKAGKSGTGSASEETILGQPQTYAQSIHSYDYARLNEVYQRYKSDIAQGRWDVPERLAPADALRDAHESVFGVSLKPDEFNSEQRMVVVAEEITRQTEQNARYLLNNGMNIQCVEVQCFERDGSQQRTVATNTVVDYDLSRVRPARAANPTYPEVISELVDLTFPKVRHLVESGSPGLAFENTDSYRPRLQSNHTDHPDGLKYVFYLRPVEWNSIIVAIDYMGQDEDTLDTLLANAEVFEVQGFHVNPNRSRDRIVGFSWDVDSAEVLNDETFLTEVAERFVTLVETGHDVFTAD
ncbi:hypothetical protein [Haloarchaeobius sp. DYHT-AS-18]|uniref:hypothetical protein n=1 Tax=Haloarchaeobius sp. DYHT-AS-18 TaxID=3446117 RepID=UPI003EC06296